MQLPITKISIHTRGWFNNSNPHTDDPDYYYLSIGTEEFVITKFENVYDPKLYTLVKK
jgi:hypothetical protein